MKIAVISDTHMPRGTRALPADCSERLRAADLILHGGDVVGDAFLEELLALGPPVEAVHGNMDDPALKAYGHTHVPQVERHEGVWILNPGSPTERRSAPARTMLELVVEGRDVAPQLVSFGA
jgi:uncharacterized protein